MIKFALFGAGFIGKIHGANIVKHPQAELTYLYDVNRAAAEQLAVQLGSKAADDPEKIWTSDVDAVLIASSTNTHADLLRSAIQSNKPTYCEKPIDLDMDRVKDVVQQAAQTDLPILIGFSRRFDTNHLGVRQAVQNGDIGKLEMMHITSRGPQPPPLSYVKVSGGQLRDQTIHFFDMLRWLADEDPVAADRIPVLVLHVRAHERLVVEIGEVVAVHGVLAERLPVRHDVVAHRPLLREAVEAVRPHVGRAHGAERRPSVGTRPRPELPRRLLRPDLRLRVRRGIVVDRRFDGADPPLDDRVDRSDVPCRRFNLVEARQNGHLMRNSDARAPKIAKRPQALDGITDGLNLPRQIHKIESQFLKGRIVDGRRERVFDRVSDYPAKLCCNINLHHGFIPWRRSFPRRS